MRERGFFLALVGSVKLFHGDFYREDGVKTDVGGMKSPSRESMLFFYGTKL